ncbi:C-type lectin 16-like [Rhynchophorus ferrugineus]|uniref:C-type lectin 16-like n=1 Tax=Rhynchophorus ferrugineus TaxID=354439 RepID=UPI003FCEA921
MTEQDQKDVEDLLKYEDGLDTAVGFWIFATNLGDKSSYHWLHSGRSVIYSVFFSYQPNNADNIENSLQIFQLTKGSFFWNDVPCAFNLRFICQYKNQ